MSTASTTTVSASPASASTPAASPASGPPPAGASRARSSRRLLPCASPALSAPPIRDAVPPVSTTAAQPPSSPIPSSSQAGWQAAPMPVVLVQEASSQDPEVNRRRLAELVPDGADLVVLPEAFARDFGDPGSDVAPHAEPLDGPFATEVSRVAAERGTTLVAG